LAEHEAAFGSPWIAQEGAIVGLADGLRPSSTTSICNPGSLTCSRVCRIIQPGASPNFSPWNCKRQPQQKFAA
jgi:hypothetical protein